MQTKEQIQKTICEAIELHRLKPMRIKTVRHYRDVRDNANVPLRTIEEYTKAKKRFALDNFNSDMVRIISQTVKGYITVNNCKIPVKNGALDLTQWISYKHEKTIIGLSSAEKKASKSNSQKKHREKLKAINSGLMEIEDKPLAEMTYANSQNIFHTIVHDGKTHTVKRIITAIRNIQNLYIPDMFFEECVKRPLVKNIFMTTESQTVDKKKNIYQETLKDFEIRTERENKHYEPMPLYLIDVSGQKWLYGEKGLIPI